MLEVHPKAPQINARGIRQKLIIAEVDPGEIRLEAIVIAIEGRLLRRTRGESWQTTGRGWGNLRVIHAEAGVGLRADVREGGGCVGGLLLGRGLIAVLWWWHISGKGLGEQIALVHVFGEQLP